MSNLEELLISTRKRYVEARTKGDLIGMRLFEKVGNGIKDRMAERLGLQTKDQEIEKIFGGKLQK